LAPVYHVWQAPVASWSVKKSNPLSELEPYSQKEKANTASSAGRVRLLEDEIGALTNSFTGRA
jgi:hypothetical protein